MPIAIAPSPRCLPHGALGLREQATPVDCGRERDLWPVIDLAHGATDPPNLRPGERSVALVGLQPAQDAHGGPCDRER